MKRILIIFILFLGGCSFIASKDKLCQKLSISVAENDTIDFDADREYGVGDDGLFTANDPDVYKLKNGIWYNISDVLDDYDLTTSMDLLLINKIPDTLCIIVNFPGLVNHPNLDTVGLINGIIVFNGNRKNMTSWEKSGKLKQVEFLHNGISQGCAELENTYKSQFVKLTNPIALLRGNSDTFSIIVQSTYSTNNKCSISEVKLDGEIMY